MTNAARWRSLCESPGTVAAFAILAHLPALGNKLGSDDIGALRSPDLRTLRGLWRVLALADSLRGSLPDADPGALPVYRPVSAVFDWLSWQLGRSDALTQHGIGVALHAVAAVLLLRTLVTFGTTSRVATFGALLFAVHPVTAEAVAVLSARSLVLGAIVLLFALHRLHVAHVVQAGAWAFAGAVGAVLCHEAFVIAPLVFLVASLSPRGAPPLGSGETLQRSLAIAVGGACGIATAVALPGWTRSAVPLGAWARTAGGLAFHDVQVTLLPSLGAPLFTPPAIGLLGALCSFGLAAAAAVALVVRGLRNERWAAPLRGTTTLAAGLVLMFGAPLALAPAALRGGVSSDRGTYVFLVGASLFLTVLADAVASRLSRSVPPVAALAPFALALGLVPLAWSRDIAWEDDTTLRRTLAAGDGTDPESALAAALLRFDEGDVDGAYKDCASYAAARPRSTRANLCVGTELFAHGDSGAALDYLRPYARLRPHQERARLTLFTALVANGQLAEARLWVSSWRGTFPSAPDVEAARTELVRQGAW